MRGSNLSMAFRNLKKDRVFSAVNLLGLTLALVCSLLILLWVHKESSIDNFHKDGKDIYIVYENMHVEGKINSSYRTQGILAEALKERIPEIELASNVAWLKDEPDKAIFRLNDKAYQFDTYYANSSFFKILSYPLIQGTPADALRSKEGVCISEKMARAIFGDATTAFGKVINYEGRKDLKITGIFKDIPDRASHKFDCVINWATFLSDNQWASDWGNVGTNTLIKLKKGSDPDLTAKKIRHLIDTYVKPDKHYSITLGLQKFKDSYLYDKIESGVISGGKIEYVRLFKMIALLIMIIACINFVNLSTARAIHRAKSTAIRKIIGAQRWKLIFNYLTEAFIVTVFATALALVAVAGLIPLFNKLAGGHTYLPFKESWFWLALAVLITLTTLAAGLYPAFVLTSFKPISFLQRSLASSKGSLVFRKGLVVFQFILANTLIAGTLVIFQQIRFIHNQSLGFDRNNLIEIPLSSSLAPKYEVFKNEAMAINGVEAVSKMGENPTSIGSLTFGISWQGKDPEEKIMFSHAPVGYDFVRTLKLHLTAGRDFSKDFPTDTSGYVINETAQKIMGYKNAIGKPLNLWGREGTIIGVLKDFHFSSLHDPIRPLILHYGEKEAWGNILVRTDPAKTKAVLTSLEQLNRTLTSGSPFSYSFADDDFNKLYQKEELLSRLSGYFSFLAIFISCLGLLGLVIFAAVQRTKEIGIRKILGAGSRSLFAILLKEFIELIVLSVFIALPISYFLIDKWLHGYAYKTTLHWWIFALAGVICLFIALLTVGYQTYKTVKANPVNSLRVE